MWLHSSVGRASHRHRGGHGFESRLKTEFMSVGVRQRIEPLGVLGPVVRKVDNTIHRINRYPADSVVCFVNTYPVDSDLSGG